MFKNTHHIFGITAFVCGLLLVFTVPPFQSPDEFNHFFRSWQISDGVFIGVRTADNRLGGDLPKSLAKIAEPFRILPFQTNNHINSDTIFTLLTVPLAEKERTFMDFSNTAVYAPTAYVPQIIVICTGKIFKMHPLSIFYLARIFTLIAWISMVYISIKIIPYEKTLFAALALLPSSLFINASLNADVVTNGLSFLTISIFIKLIMEKKNVSIKYILILFITTTIISLNKLAYFPLVFLILIARKENFGGVKNKQYISSFLIAVNVAVIVFWSRLISPLYINFEDYHPLYRVGQQLNENVNPHNQLNFIIHNPLYFLQICISSLFNTLPSTLIHYIGKFGWEKNYLPIWLICIILILLFIHAINQKLSLTQRVLDPLSNSNKLTLFFIGLLMCIGLCGAMYLIWCPVGSSFIDNLSGKYFIPIYPLFFLALPVFDMSKYKIWSVLAKPQTLYVTLLFAFIWFICQVISRYYV